MFYLSSYYDNPLVGEFVMYQHKTLPVSVSKDDSVFLNPC